MPRISSALPACLLVLLLAGCAGLVPDGRPGAQVRLEPRSGSPAAGELAFTRRGDTLRLTGTVSGLKPGAEHGFHVHEKGDCSSVDAMTAGGHFNPGGAPHGHAAAGGPHHAGDLPNLKADAQGRATVDLVVKGLVLDAQAANGIVGRSVVVHRDPDDYRSQPAGNSGARIACGVITAAR